MLKEEEIKKRTGVLRWRMWEFEIYFLANAMYKFYVEDDPAGMRSLLFNQAKIHYIYTLENWNNWEDRSYTLFRVFGGLPVLLSDHDGIISWYSNLDSVLINDRINDHHSYEYQIKNFFIAMRGEWDLLEERSRRYIADPRSKPRNRWIMDTYQYYLGLATGDVARMENALAEFVKPRFLRSRADVESGYTADIISTEAVVLAKLAWRNGYEVNIDSPYVPKEWLPVKPLVHYEDEFDFMKAYTIDPTWGGKFS
ncbi:MAG: Imm49 family immunity protein [Advenella sp.]|uniref:Uncharacterized protein n=1 Tax=Advenella kashmirensis TaxID=310575 RepID=A0A356LJ05_9BURK|nr:Imm49 family immunity protein [Advenella sp. FME57]HBP30990.1 hypothetical protein [Advenella kashmirensis]